jgi:hypothetical protein
MTWNDLQPNIPFRLYRLIHDVLGCQMGADPDLAALTEWKWRLALEGIPTHIVSEWLTFPSAEGRKRLSPTP